MLSALDAWRGAPSPLRRIVTWYNGFVYTRNAKKKQFKLNALLSGADLSILPGKVSLVQQLKRQVTAGKSPEPVFLTALSVRNVVIRPFKESKKKEETFKDSCRRDVV